MKKLKKTMSDGRQIQRSNTISITPQLEHEFNRIIESARRISADVGDQVEEILREGREHPLEPVRMVKLLEKVITVLKESAKRREDGEAMQALAADVDSIVEEIMQKRLNVKRDGNLTNTPSKKLKLFSVGDVKVGLVKPVPYFRGKSVPMRQGYLLVRDIRLWDHNDRLMIHLAQFREKERRDPTQEELSQMLLNQLALVEAEEDQFKIPQLAKNIAENGLQRPPILDWDFTLLDGNRRVAACRYILDNDNFDTQTKKRVEKIYVWQLTEGREDIDRDNVIIALNFEEDFKEKWPIYVKASRVYNAWQEMLLLEPVPSETRRRQMRRELADRFSLEMSFVDRYLRLMEWAEMFQEYHVNEKHRDKFAVQHKANKLVNYFEELSKGRTPESVAYEVSRDEALKELTFDLLYKGVFENFPQIRELKYIYANQEAREALERARDASALEDAKQHFSNAMVLANEEKAIKREQGANKRIEVFVKWLEGQVSAKTFRDAISDENLKHLLKALQLVEPLVKATLDERKGKKN